MVKLKLGWFVVVVVVVLFRVLRQGLIRSPRWPRAPVVLLSLPPEFWDCKHAAAPLSSCAFNLKHYACTESWAISKQSLLHFHWCLFEVAKPGGELDAITGVLVKLYHQQS